jgi:hypothetical protein
MTIAAAAATATAAAAAAAAAAAVCLQDGNDSGVINIPAVSNCLSLLMRDAGLMRFVKYVSAAAPGSR